MEKLDRDTLSSSEYTILEELVRKIRSECPGQIQSRYISRIVAYQNELPKRIYEHFWSKKKPIIVSNLPQFEDIEDSKILLLILGETIGKCVAFSEYNQSYITDIQPTPLSAEASSGTDVLGMHNDLAFATDICRPAALVLVPHIADGTVPKTLIATAESVISSLSPDVVDLLQQDIFEIRSGSKLRWPCEQVRRISVIDKDAEGRPRVRLNFDNIRPITKLDEEQSARAQEALTTIAQEALRIGRLGGHRILKGEALFIPNDYCLHGRDTFENPECKRLLLRSYVLTQDMVDQQHGNTMLSLRF